MSNFSRAYSKSSEGEIEMNTMTTTNQRLVTLLLVLLVIFVGLLIIGTLTGSLFMGGGMMNGLMGMNGQSMSKMMAVCSEMMRNFQNY